MEKLDTLLAADADALENMEQQLERAKEMQFQPFPQEQELSEKSARLTALTQELSLEKKQKAQEQISEDEEPLADQSNNSLANRISKAKQRLDSREKRSATSTINRIIDNRKR